MIVPANLRPSWDIILSMIVLVISCLATCMRLQVGALLWNPKTKKIVAIAYNGAPRGMPSCDEVGCLIVDGHCVRSLHADTNVLYWAGEASEGCDMFLTHNPCRRCCNHIIQGKIRRVVYMTPYGDPRESALPLDEAGIPQVWVGNHPILQAFLTFLKESGILGVH